MKNGSSYSIKYPIKYSSEVAPSFEFIPVELEERGLCPKKYRDRIGIDTIHDGHIIPERLLESPRIKPLVKDGTLWRYYIKERDWGANLVAEHVARSLGLSGYNRITKARVVMDFNRFPGSSLPGAALLDRMAIIEPFSTHLDHVEKRLILNRLYDTVSHGMESAIYGKLLKISIHTYDAFNPSRTERPEVSLITRSNSYQIHSRLPDSVFDPLFPDILVESTCNSILRDRIGLTLEKTGVSVEHNYPYCASDGALEVRAQPWFYFQKVRSLFEQIHPDTRRRFAFDMVWDMLLNTNLRDGDSEALKGYIHRFQGAPAGREVDFDAAREAYETIATFARSDLEYTNEYRRSPFRTNTFSIEVRKDLVFRFDGDEPVAPLEDNAREIGRSIAKAISTYLKKDFDALVQHSEEQRRRRESLLEQDGLEYPDRAPVDGTGP